MKAIIFFSIAMLFFVPTLSAQQLEKLMDIDDTQKIYYLSLIWKEIDYNYPFMDQFERHEWDKIYQEYLPYVLDTDNLYDYYRVLQRYTAEVKDCNTRIVLPPAISSLLNYPLIELKEIEGKIIITNIGKKYNENIPIGSELLEIDNQSVQPYLEEKINPYISASNPEVLKEKSLLLAFVGEKDTFVPVKVRTPENTISETELMRNWQNDSWTEFVWNKELVLHDWLDDEIVYIEMNRFNDYKIEEMFAYIIEDIRNCKGIILDLRDNNYGITDVAYEMLGYFTTAEKLPYAKITSRKHIPLYKALGTPSPWYGYQANENYLDYGQMDVWIAEDAVFYDNDPEKEKILTPLIILISQKTTSPAEDFVMVLKELRDDVITIGTHTSGRRGQAITHSLPFGGQLWITTSKDLNFKGKPVSRKGVAPDYKIRQTYDDYLNNKDTVKEEGSRLLKELIQSR